MRFSITRLCGGEAISLSPETMLRLDLDDAEGILMEAGHEVDNDGLMLVANVEGVSTTIYRTGRMMMHPMKDKERAVELGNHILELLGKVDGNESAE